MRINNNVMALNAHRQLGINQSGASKSMEKLSSGFRINRAGDDAAGLAISEKMRGQIRGLKQASRNAQDGISLIQTAEGALNETHAILQRMRELAVQASTDTNTPEDRYEIQKEIDQLATEITRISTDTEFNTMELLDGSYEGKFFHIGANKGQNVTIAVEDMSADALKVAGDGKLDLSADPLTEGTEDVHEISGYNTLSDSEGVVAVEIDGKWYNPADVLVDANEDKLVVAEGAKAVTVAKGQTIDGEFVIEGTATVDGVKNQEVLKNSDDEVVAVKVGDDYYDVDHVEKGADGKLAVKLDGDDEPEEPIEIEEGLAIGEANGINVSSRAAANDAIKTIDDAIVTVSGERSKLGAMQNRLEHTIANLGTSAENLQAAESRIRDLDMADEIMAFTKNNILQQAATAMLAQANMAPQSVLQLLG